MGGGGGGGLYPMRPIKIRDLIETKPQVLGSLFYGCRQHPRRIKGSTAKGVYMELDVSIWGCQMRGRGRL